MINIKLSVHQLVDFMLRSGDIDTRIFNKATLLEGTRLHGYYQRKYGSQWLSELFVSHTYQIGKYAITLEGKADGVRMYDDYLRIDEIKTTIADLSSFADQHELWHKMQAVCYAHILCFDHGYEKAEIALLYFHQTSGDSLVRSFSYSTEEMEQLIIDLLTDYVVFYDKIASHINKRNKSVKGLTFPFDTFREGQRELAKYAYSLAIKGGNLFVEAPTGIGKTISTLYPFVLSFANNDHDHIFYVTAKNITHEAARIACNQIRQRGADIWDISLLSKEKLCLTPGAGCNPDECPFAVGYYNKIRQALSEIIGSENQFNEAVILAYAKTYNLCPFELQLDISTYIDVIISDYNYVYDPIVYLRRFFDVDAKRNLLLVDEAHNLVERSKEMYSSSISEVQYKLMRKALKNQTNDSFKKAINKIGTLINKYKKEYKSLPYKIEEIKQLIVRLEAFINQSLQHMKNHKGPFDRNFIDFYLEVNRFVKIFEHFDHRFIMYLDRDNDEKLLITMRCLDSKHLIAQSDNKLKARLLFSATLSPINYYVDMLGGHSDDPVLQLSSPFPRENLLLMVAYKVSTRYNKRQKTMSEIALYIELAINGKIGNYLVFFPSYKYLNDVLAHIQITNANILVQTKEMNRLDHEQFLAQFKHQPSVTTVGFVVLGGAFSESIDLLADRLIGSIIIGVGLPQLSYERDLMKEYFNQSGYDGYAYSYAYPGMNKVMQAVGRVIRSSEDKGIALLIDDRYLSSSYRQMFKPEWRDYQVVVTPDDLVELLKTFYDNHQ
jgi:DNA excision repair protein ERCC-2